VKQRADFRAKAKTACPAESTVPEIVSAKEALASAEAAAKKYAVTIMTTDTYVSGCGTDGNLMFKVKEGDCVSSEATLSGSDGLEEGDENTYNIEVDKPLTPSEICLTLKGDNGNGYCAHWVKVKRGSTEKTIETIYEDKPETDADASKFYHFYDDKEQCVTVSW